ncbi:MAG TPA: WG repeat-containing protein, partial [Phormidium sp.]
VKIGPQNGFIDTTGKIVFQTPEGSFKSFSEGLAAFTINSKVGYIDRTGKVVIEPQFDTADPYPESYDFSEGLAVIRMNNKFGYIDKTGKIVIEPKFDGALPFSQDKAEVRFEGKRAIIDKAGKYLIEPQYSLSEYELIGPFSEGLAQVLKLWEGVGYIDETGKLVIPAQFNGTGVFPGDARHAPYFKGDGKFSEGLAAVEIQRKWGYIDKTGKMVIQPQYEAAWAFSEGLARVNVGGEWNGMQNYIEGGKWGYIKHPLK